MQLRLNIPNCSNIIITNHAKQRLLQRSKLFLTKTELSDLAYTIKKEFKKSFLKTDNESSPFMRNLKDLKYGVGNFETNSLYFTFIGNYDLKTDTVLIKTVLFTRNKK